MSTTTAFTAEQLLALPMGMGKRYELVAGELRVMSPSGWRHGTVTDNVQHLLGTFIRHKKLGRGFGAETGFLLSRNPDTVRAPDFAYIASGNLPASDPVEAFWPGAPDLAVEVLSPGDTTGEVNEKIEEWLSAGCEAVWIVDPRLETVTIYWSKTKVRLYTSVDMLDGSPLLSGFTCPVREFFQ